MDGNEVEQVVAMSRGDIVTIVVVIVMLLALMVIIGYHALKYQNSKDGAIGQQNRQDDCRNSDGKRLHDWKWNDDERQHQCQKCKKIAGRERHFDLHS